MDSGKSTAIPPTYRWFDLLIYMTIYRVFFGGFPGLSTGLPDFFGRLALAASKKRGYKGCGAPDPAAAPGCVWDGPGGVSSNMATWEIAAWNGLFKRTIIETLKFVAFSSQPCLFTGGYMLLASRRVHGWISVPVTFPQPGGHFVWTGQELGVPEHQGIMTYYDITNKNIMD